MVQASPNHVELPSRSIATILGRWSPAPIPRASLWLHAAGACALAIQPALWPQVLGVLAGNHALLAALMHPRSTQLGPNLVRLPPALSGAVALTFDDGPDPDVTPRVLDLLDRHRATASFFVIGERAHHHQALLREIVARGHSVENHSHRHPATFACRGLWALRREVGSAQNAIADATGVAPRFFRAPMGLRNPLLEPVLSAEGLRLVTWTRRGFDTSRRDPRRILASLADGLRGREILLLHDGVARWHRAQEAVVLKVLPMLLQRITAAGLYPVSLARVPAQPDPTAEPNPRAADVPNPSASVIVRTTAHAPTKARVNAPTSAPTSANANANANAVR